MDFLASILDHGFVERASPKKKKKGKKKEKVSSTLRLRARGRTGTHLGVNTQVLPGAQSQPQEWQLLALLFLIEAE